METVFFEKLYHKILPNLHNDYTDNYCVERFGKEQITQKQNSNTSILLKPVDKLIKSKGFWNVYELYPYIEKCIKMASHFNYLYSVLDNEESKSLLVDIAAFRVLGYRKFKLPLNTHKYWSDTKMTETLMDTSKKIPLKGFEFDLYLADLAPINYPIKMYQSTLGIYTQFVLKQYEVKQGNVEIKAQVGDTVLDCGGCWGDTALFFANEVGDQGQVHVFEFIPSNLKLMRENLSMSQSSLLDIIKIVEYPVYKESGKELYYVDKGPGSKITDKEENDSDGKVKTISIDDYVNNTNLEKIDFIKMDIEGAELDALKGAEQTIKKFKPKLAIALYHSLEDFDTIPRYIKQINPDYKLYLNHYTIFGEETILFAE